MNWLKKYSFPPVGQRIIRSVIAVALCFVVWEIRGEHGIPFYSAIAVLQCVQPYHEGAKSMAKKRATGTFVGAFWGLIMLLFQIYILGGRLNETFLGYLICSAFVGVVLYSTVLMKCTNSSYFSCVVFLSITINHIGDENPYLFVLNRVIDTLIGVALGVFVNWIHFPREKRDDILFVSGLDNTLLNKKNQLSSYSKIELNRMIDSGMNFTISSIRTPANVIQAMSGVKLKLPVITMDGAALYDIHEYSYPVTITMSTESAKRVTDYIKAAGFRCFMNTITEDLLIIYYEELINEAEIGVYKKRRKSPYRNYMHSDITVCENVAYIYLIDQAENVEDLYLKLLEQPWAGDYRIEIRTSEQYKGYAYLKIYDKDATREHMLEILKARLNLQETVVFTSRDARGDICVANSDNNALVKQLKKLYRPLKRWV